MFWGVLKVFRSFENFESFGSGFSEFCVSLSQNVREFSFQLFTPRLNEYRLIFDFKSGVLKYF